MRLSNQHKRDIYAAVMEPFVRDIRVAYATLAHKVHETEFVHKLFDAEKPDIDQHLNELQNFYGVDMINHTAKRQEIFTYTGNIAREFLYSNDLIPQHHRMRSSLNDGPAQDLIYFDNGLEYSKGANRSETGPTQAAAHTGALLKEWCSHLRDPKNFEELIRMDTRIPDEFKQTLLEAPLQSRYYHGSALLIPCIPTLWEKTGAGDEAANIWTTLKVAINMHRTLSKVLQVTTYKKLLDTMPQLKSIIPAYIHAAEEASKERTRAAPTPIEKETIDVAGAAQALTIKRLQGQL